MERLGSAAFCRIHQLSVKPTSEDYEPQPRSATPRSAPAKPTQLAACSWRLRRAYAARRRSSLDGARLEVLELLLEGDDGEDVGSGPTRLNTLISEIHSLGRWDGVRVRLGAHGKRAFRDSDLVITGRAQTTVRVARKR